MKVQASVVLFLEHHVSSVWAVLRLSSREWIYCYFRTLQDKIGCDCRGGWLVRKIRCKNVTGVCVITVRQKENGRKRSVWGREGNWYQRQIFISAEKSWNQNCSGVLHDFLAFLPANVRTMVLEYSLVCLTSLDLHFDYFIIFDQTQKSWGQWQKF